MAYTLDLQGVEFRRQLLRQALEDVAMRGSGIRCPPGCPHDQRTDAVNGLGCDVHWCQPPFWSFAQDHEAMATLRGVAGLVARAPTELSPADASPLAPSAQQVEALKQAMTAKLMCCGCLQFWEQQTRLGIAPSEATQRTSCFEAVVLHLDELVWKEEVALPQQSQSQLQSVEDRLHQQLRSAERGEAPGTDIAISLARRHLARHVQQLARSAYHATILAAGAVECLGLHKHTA